MTKFKDSKLDFLEPDIYTGIVKPLPYTTAELNAIPNPESGWLAQNSTVNSLWRYDGTGWKDLTLTGYDAFVGDGFEYPDLQSALAANKSRIAVVGNVTESSEAVAPVGTTSLLISFYVNYTTVENWDFSNCNNVELNGFSGASITFAITTGIARDAITMTVGKNILIRNLSVFNASNIGSTFPSSKAITHVSQNVSYNCINTNQTFLFNGYGSYGQNITINTTGSAAGTVLTILGGARIDGANITGDQNIAHRYIIIDENSTLENFVITIPSNKTYTIQHGGYLLNGRIIGTVGNVSISFVSPGTIVDSIRGDYSSVGNVKLEGLTNEQITISNCWQLGQDSTVTWTGARPCFINNDYYGTIDFGSGASSGRVINNDMTGGRTGGSRSINFLAGADNNNCIGNTTDIAITNAGAGNNISNNIVV